MRILFVSPYLPYPSVPHAGGVYVLEMIEGLARRGHAVSVLSYATPAELPHVPEVERTCERVVALPVDPALRGSLRHLPRHLLHPAAFQVWHPGLRDALARMTAGDAFDVVQFQWTEMGQFVDVVEERIPSVMLVHDLAALTASRTLANERSPLRRAWLAWYVRDARRLEAETYPRFDHVLTLSEKDRRWLDENVPGVRASVLRPWVDAALSRSPVAPVANQDILFVGSMHRPPNVQAVRWFHDQVFPLVRARVPGARLRIVGDSPTPEVRALAADPGVVVTGRVDRIEDHYRTSRLTVVPVLVGGGIIKKALDALAAGCPVVATRRGVEGIDVEDGREALVADDPARFADATIRLLQDDALWGRLVQAGRDLIHRDHDWEATMADLEALYERLG